MKKQYYYFNETDDARIAITANNAEEAREKLRMLTESPDIWKLYSLLEEEEE